MRCLDASRFSANQTLAALIRTHGSYYSPSNLARSAVPKTPVTFPEFLAHSIVKFRERHNIVGMNFGCIFAIVRMNDLRPVVTNKPQ